jgi:hypothetical protein
MHDTGNAALKHLGLEQAPVQDILDSLNRVIRTLFFFAFPQVKPSPTIYKLPSEYDSDRDNHDGKDDSR